MKYYELGGTRVALRKAGAVSYLFGDHLGSTTLTYNPATGATARQLYTPYGEPRWPDPSTLPTDRKFTGQRSEKAGLGSLYDYGARHYSPYLNRWIQPDTIIPDPGDPQDLNRYAYCRNNPLKLVDPSGHVPIIPPQIPILEILKHPYVQPLWTNPLIGVPVVLGLYREAKGDAPEALSLTVNWYFERGEAPREFGGDSEISQSLIRSPGVQEARQKFIAGGGKDMIGHGDGAYWHEYSVGEYVNDLGKAISADDWSGAMIGSFDVEFRSVAGYEGPGRMVEVRVVNDTGWASATKIPILKTTIRQNVDRTEPGPGGTLWQRYRWWEVIDAE